MTDLKSVENYLYEHALAGVLSAALRVEPDGPQTVMGNAGNTFGSIGEGELIDKPFADMERLRSELLDEVGLATEDCKKALAVIDGLEDQEMRTVFRCRYIWRMDFLGDRKKALYERDQGQNLAQVWTDDSERKI